MVKFDIVYYLEKLFCDFFIGLVFGRLFEFVVYFLVVQGGNFKMKKVCKDGKLEVIDDFKLGKLDRKVFEELGDLWKFQDGDYCELKKKNLQSVDVVIFFDIFFQFFYYFWGNYGYKIKGLQDLDDVLKKLRYCLFFCVFEDIYDFIGFQNFLYVKGKQVSRGYKEKLQGKMDQYVVMVDFKCFGCL